jgi:acetolactate synthase-1/2/3 large subunit
MNNHQEWVNKCQHWKNKWPIFNIKDNDDSEGINIYSFIEILNKHSFENEIYVSDAGSAYYVTCQNLKIKEKQKFIISGSQAEMGFALPASIGVYFADNTKNVIVITGDGSFNTNIQELATIKYFNLPIKIFILNNNGYLSIKNTQKKFYEGREYGTGFNKGIWFPQLEKIAKAYEFDYIKIDSNEKLIKNITNILSNKNPIICEVICKEIQEIVPTLALKKDEKTGKNIQCGLDDMYPFLSEEELKQEKYE